MITKMVEEVKRETLTDRQYEVYTFIRNELVSGRPAPTVRELMDEFGTSSPNGMRGHLVALRKKGWIDFQPNAKRSITLVTKPVENSYVLHPGEMIQIGDVSVKLDKVCISGVAYLTIQNPDCIDVVPDPDVLLIED